jgi:hypothetical protein
MRITLRTVTVEIPTYRRGRGAVNRFNPLIMIGTHLGPTDLYATLMTDPILPADMTAEVSGAGYATTAAYPDHFIVDDLARS